MYAPKYGNNSKLCLTVLETMSRSRKLKENATQKLFILSPQINPCYKDFRSNSRSTVENILHLVP